MSSWDGSRNHIDLEVAKDRRSEKRNHWDDDYEEELDVGKVCCKKKCHALFCKA